MVVYVHTQGARIVKEGKHLLVKKGNDIHHTLFLYKLSQLVLLGNIEISHAARVQLFRNEVDTVFLTKNGRYLGRFTGREAKNVFLRRNQFALAEDEAFGLDFAIRVVVGKLTNMATLLHRIRRSRNAAPAGREAARIQDLMDKLADVKGLDSLRGYEGRGSAYYFSGLGFGFVMDLGFRKRVRRPPTDPVNSVLSLLYTFLMNRVYSAVKLVGLDPYVGYLHTLDYGRHSLVLDLMEEFRTIVADSLALSLFNLRILKQDDFIRDDASDNDEDDVLHSKVLRDVTKDPMGLFSSESPENEQFDLPEQHMEKQVGQENTRNGKMPVRLKPPAFKRVIEAFEKKLTTEFFHPLADRKMSYRDAIHFQAMHYRQIVEGETSIYRPLLLK